MTAIRMATGLLGLALLSGCATAAVDEAAMQQAEAALQSVQTDAQINAAAPVAVRQAAESYATAQAAAKQGESARAEHFAYMTVKNAELARTQTRERMAVARRQELANQSAELRLQAAQTRAEDLAQQLQAREAERTRTGTVIATYDLPFATGSASLQPGATTRLQALVNYLQQKPTERVEVRGHTDSVGPGEFNQRLSQARADAIRSYLVSQGIDAARITAVGMGESFPIATNETATGRAQNRRVEIELSSLPE